MSKEKDDKEMIACKYDDLFDWQHYIWKEYGHLITSITCVRKINEYSVYVAIMPKVAFLPTQLSNINMNNEYYLNTWKIQSLYEKFNNII